MQKLQKKLKNTPRNTSLVPCSVNSSLNKDENLSDLNKVLICNNSEENHQKHKSGSIFNKGTWIRVIDKYSKILNLKINLVDKYFNIGSLNYVY